MNIFKRFIAFFALLVFAYGCSQAPKPSLRVINFDEKTGVSDPVPKGGGIYKVGKPYKIDGQSFRPREYKRYSRVGVASWYGSKFHGRYTANGEIFDMNSISAAHPLLPMPTLVKVTNLENNRQVVVRVNDRGPFKKNREIDLSRATAELLGFKEKGTARVKVELLRTASIENSENLDRQKVKYLQNYSQNQTKKQYKKRKTNIFTTIYENYRQRLLSKSQYKQ